MRIRNWSELYTFGYGMVGVGVEAFFKRNETIGRHNIPKNKPVLFASNHQSAFMDPVVVAVRLSKPTYYMVRADIFKKKLAAKAFAAMNMLPIYRARDGGDTVKKNEAVFNECYDILQKNRSIIIFPEGNHDHRKRLRPLKKGVFRIGFGAEEKYGKDLDVHVIPVGINYSDNRNMGATMLISFGEPIRLNDYWDEYQEGKAQTLNKLMDRLAEKMSDLLIDIQNLDYYDTIEDAIDLFDEEIYELEAVKNNKLIEQFHAKKSFIAKISSYIEQNPVDADTLKAEMKEYHRLLKKNRLKSWLVRKEKHNVILQLLLLALIFPVHVYGVINSYLPYKIPEWFVNKKVKDTQFHSSVKMGMGSFLLLLFWLIQTLLVAAFTDYHIWAIYLCSLILSSKLSYSYWIGLLKVSGKIRYNKLRKKNRATYDKIRNLHQNISTSIGNIYKTK